MKELIARIIQNLTLSIYSECGKVQVNASVSDLKLEYEMDLLKLVQGVKLVHTAK